MTRFRTLCVAFALLVPIFAAADDRLNGIGAKLMSGQAKEVREAIVQARDAYVASNDLASEASAWLLLGMCDAALNDGVTAHRELEQAASKFNAGGDLFGEWLSLLTMGQLETGQGHFAESIATYERALADLHAVAEPGSKFSLETLKLMGSVFGMETDGLSPLASFPEVIKPMLLQFAEVTTRDAYGHALVEAGQLERAEEQLEKATAASVLFGGAYDASLAAHIGDLRRSQWRFDEARKSYVKALQSVTAMPIASPAQGQFVEIEILGKLAELEQLSGHLDDALAWNDRALKLVRDAGNVKRVNSLLADRATLMQNGGRFSDAEKGFNEALEAARTSGDVRLQASIHSDLGALFMFEGSYGTSATHLEKAIELYQEMKEPYLEAPVWTLLAEVDMLLDAQNNAADALEHAKALAKKSGFGLAGAMVSMLTISRKYMAGKASTDEVNEAFKAWWDMPETKSLMFNADAQMILRQIITIDKNTASPGVQPDAVRGAGPGFFRWTALMLKGKVAFEHGQYDEARKYWNEALNANPSRDHRAGFLGLIGASYWREGKAAEAINYFTKAADTLDASAADVKVEELLTGYLGSNRRWYYELLIDMLVSQGRYAEAFAQAERARARAFLQLVGNHRLNAERGGEPVLAAEAETLRTQIARWEQQRTRARAEDAEKLDANIENGRKRYQTLLIRLKVSNPEYASVTNVEPLPLATVRENLPDGAAMISYFVSTHFVHAWVVSSAGMHYATLPLDTEKLQRIVCWASHFAPQKQQDRRGALRNDIPCGAMATDEEAFGGLVAPLLDHLGGATKLVLVPHGVLHYVPFAALRSHETGRYLLQDYTLVYAPSGSALRFLHAKESAMERRALVIGNPRTPLPLPALNAAENEAKAVAEMFGTTAHLGAQANESLFYDLGGKFDFVHIAAHGLYDGDNPLFSRIALAADDKQDGSLTVHEILSSVDLSGTKLVVLSACQSAIGARTGGDEIVGLTRALLYAGTPNVISTLWNINDAASADLMTDFYRRLTSGSSAAVALRQAQIHMLENPAFHDPKYWAAFTLNGDPQGWTKP